jgi:uracil-DNA glycosylase
VDEVMALVIALAVAGAVNLYDEADSVAFGDEAGLATTRRHALHRYLTTRWSAPVVLVGEAPGRNGARWTGVPFTSPRLLTGSGPAEATATVVHRVLAELGREADVLLWNASVLYPPGNRDPRRAELDACAPVLERVCRGRLVVAVGRHAQVATGARYVRHPSHGGASRFTRGLTEVLGQVTVGTQSSRDRPHVRRAQYPPEQPCWSGATLGLPQ